MNYSAFSTYSCIRYYEFFKLAKLLGGQNDMFAPPIFSLGGGGGRLPPPPPAPPGSTPLPSTFRAITLQRTKLSPRHFMTIYFEFPAHFDTKFVTPGGRIFLLHDSLAISVKYTVQTTGYSLTQKARVCSSKYDTN